MTWKARESLRMSRSIRKFSNASLTCRESSKINLINDQAQQTESLNKEVNNLKQQLGSAKATIKDLTAERDLVAAAHTEKGLTRKGAAKGGSAPEYFFIGQSNQGTPNQSGFTTP